MVKYIFHFMLDHIIIIITFETKMRYLIICSVLLLASCESWIKTNDSDTEEHVKRSFYPNGKVRSEVFYDDSSRIKLARNYYEDGKLSTEIPYHHGVRHGIAKKYYKNGQVYRETPYIANKKNGIQKKYYEDGQIRAEIPYQNGMPGKSIKEFTTSGKVRSNYPAIEVEEINRVQITGQYIIKLWLSNKSSTVKFYNTTLIDGKYLDLKSKPLYVKNGIAEMKLHVQPGHYILEQFTIVAFDKTRDNNPLILTKKLNIAAEN